MVPAAGLEPARPFGQEILSLRCLPFHHAGTCLVGIVYAVNSEGARGRDLDIFACWLNNQTAFRKPRVQRQCRA